MYIKSIVIDGFKSYGTRTEIKGFDREFNAITGLNGTGKSNILDSICFVLGISNLTHVRAQSLQDLIYKSGQAGVTKASVSIVFDNSDTSKSPLNFEDCREITVTRQIVVAGKNRYMINGSTVTNKNVNDFFNSIQLNVNNPHFLIMQGRITKVLNMKPPEILSMIEEAAGTRMYENKKIGAQKTIQKKDARLKEINDIVAEQVKPKIDRLKQDRSQYFEYQKLQRDSEQCTRIVVASNVLKSEDAIKDSKEKKEKTLKKIKDTKKYIEDAKVQINELEEKWKNCQNKVDKETGGKLEELEKELKEAESSEAKCSATVQSKKESITEETRKQKTLKKNLIEDEKVLKAKQAELDGAQDVFDRLRQDEQNDAQDLARAREKYENVQKGLLSNEDGEDATLQEQLMAAKQHASETETEINQRTVEIKYLKDDLMKKKPLLKNTVTTFDQDKRSLEAKENDLKSLQNELKKLNYEDGKLESLESSLRELKIEMKNDSEIIRNFNVRNPYLNFKYDEPEPNFDHKKVRGPLGKLFRLKDEKFARAIEIAAGGKLYNIVVDNEMISSKLLEKVKFDKRKTFAPLTKMQGRRMGQDVIQRAEQLVGKGKVFLAQSLIEYPPEYETVMSWCFGQTLVCTTIDVAEKVSTHRDIRKKAITLDGDAFDPSGVISGGAADKSAPVLLAIIQVHKAEENLQKKRQQCEKIQKHIDQLKPVASKYENFKQQFDLKTKEVEIVRGRLQQTSHYQLKQDLESMEKDINEKQQRIEECKQELKVKNAKISELEKNLKNQSSIKDRELKNAERELERTKKKAEESRKKWKQREQDFETLKLEISELEKAVEKCKELILKSQETIEETSKDISNFSADLTKTQDSVKEIKEKVQAHREKIAEKNKEMQQIANQKEKLKKEIGEKELEILKDEQLIESLDDNHGKATNLLKRLHQKYPWISEDREFFGQPNGMYDFTAHNPEEAEVKLEQIKQAQEKIGKHVNTNAMEVLNTQEDKYHELMKKKEIIEDDKLKILDVIGELDVKKEELIKTAWEKVNKDFNSIFHSLLPGAHAKLQPMEGKDVMAGLEVKVGFGGIWKESLDELSGGQRSLVALSLILAMLLFKPAPLYILDEVDSALDPSHTQNIGQMLKAHFKQSQFIVVSLKDGMFNNANVLFRTSFVDGMSAVTRTTNTNN